MAEYRLLADMWTRIDPDTVDDKRPRIRRLVRGDLVPGVTEEEVDYLTHGARPMLVEADSDADPFKDDADAARPGNVKSSPSADKSASASTADTKSTGSK